MSEVKINEAQVLDAYDKACKEGKQILASLFPEILGEPVTHRIGDYYCDIHFYAAKMPFYVLALLSNGQAGFMNITTGRLYSYDTVTPKEGVKEIAACNVPKDFIRIGDWKEFAKKYWITSDGRIVDLATGKEWKK